jgi:hypothetical protein
MVWSHKNDCFQTGVEVFGFRRMPGEGALMMGLVQAWQRANLLDGVEEPALPSRAAWMGWNGLQMASLHWVPT